MRVFTGALLACAVITTAAAQAPEIPLGETRLTVHTLLREDIFAGFLDNNMQRMARGERNIDALLQQRPDQRANLLAWKGAAAVYHAVLAHEAGKPEEFERAFTQAREGFAEASKLPSDGGGVPAIIGGTYSVFADRLPAQYRGAAWTQAYDSYSALWKAQQANVEQLPIHLRGELLAGMAQSAERTGHRDESAQFVDRMLTMLAETPFEKTARQWKADPASAKTTSLTCKNCHAAGRLSARIAALDK